MSTDLSFVSSVELQGLVDLARFVHSLGLAEDLGLMIGGVPNLDACQQILSEGRERGIVPRDPVVFPLDLLTSVLTNVDGKLPEFCSGEMSVSIGLRRLAHDEIEKHYYHYAVNFNGHEVAKIGCCKSGLQIHFRSEVWLLDVPKLFAAFAQKMGS